MADHHGPRGVDYEFVPLELEQPGHLADNKVLGTEAQFAADFFAWLRRIEEGLNVHAAVNCDEFVFRGDTRRDVLIGHRIAHADQKIASARSPLLGPLVKPVGDLALEGVKRRSMNRVNDWNPEFVRGGPSENSGLRAVGVDDLWLNFTQEPRQAPVTLPVAKRVNCAPQLGDDSHVELAGACAFNETAFRPQRRTGDERYVVVPQVVLIVDREQRIFLRSPENHAGDDMNDFHACHFTGGGTHVLQCRSAAMNQTPNLHQFRRVCVFCGSNAGIEPAYRHAADEMGREIVRRGWGLVYGGGSVGIMGAIADSVLAAGGEVTGVIPEMLATRELLHPQVTKMHIAPTMHARKAMMEDLSDAFIALPGGYGTFEELLEIITWAQLGIHAKPIGLLNIRGFYDRLIGFIDHAIAEGFIKDRHRHLIVSAASAAELLDQLIRHEMPQVKKWIKPEEI